MDELPLYETWSEVDSGEDLDFCLISRWHDEASIKHCRRHEKEKKKDPSYRDESESLRYGSRCRDRQSLISRDRTLLQSIDENSFSSWRSSITKARLTDLTSPLEFHFRWHDDQSSDRRITWTLIYQSCRGSEFCQSELMIQWVCEFCYIDTRSIVSERHDILEEYNSKLTTELVIDNLDRPYTRNILQVTVYQFRYDDTRSKVITNPIWILFSRSRW